MAPAGNSQVAKMRPGRLLEFTDLQGLLQIVDKYEVVDEAAADCSSAAQQQPDLRDEVKALQPGEHEALWQKILDIAGEHLKEPPQPGSDEAEAFESARALHAVAILLDVFVDEALDASRNPVLPSSFLEVASQCQEILLTIPNEKTQAYIAKALEKICTSSFEGREDFYGGVLMHLIGKCIGIKVTYADVDRLYKVRALLGELDWDHESIESLKMQLMRCTLSPRFVKSPHGPELLGLFYCVHPGFTAEVHNTVKNQILFSQPTVLKAYSLGLYRGWKMSQAGTRVQVEACVQEWVLLAVRSARKTADRARAMLEECYRHRHEEALNEVLCRIHGPILWRSLKVANAQVRENAARLLQYVFPLIPNELGVADKEQESAKQMRLLRETLEDPGEPVRRVGISAVCVILKNYWDMMPPAEIAELLTALMNRCAHDKKAPMVRAAVAEGFGWILENALSHPTMAAVLPQTADLLNDKSPIVRAAFINLLNAVSRCRGVSVSTVVSNEALLLRLAAEHTEGQAERLQKGLHSSKKGPAEPKASCDLVAKHLARLMAPSLFQQDVGRQVERCHYLMQHWPLALLALLTHLRDITPAPDRVKLAAAIFHYGLREAANPAKGSDGGQEPKVVATMLRVVGVLLEGATEPVKRRKKRGADEAAGSGNAFPKELERFVYEHIREEDFLHLLRASHEDDGAAARLRDDLLFALSPLNPVRLPRTCELVRHELMLACRGGGDHVPHGAQLTALMRTAVRWNLLGPVLEAAWERLRAAATRFEQRQPAADDTTNAIAVVEAAFRDADVRKAVLPSKVDIVKEVVGGVAGSFCNAWSAGLAALQKTSSGDDVMLLGPAAGAWPRCMGLVVRVALHVEHRVADLPKATAALQNGGAEKAGTGDEGAQQAAADGHKGFAEATLEQLASSLASAGAASALQSLEAAAAAKASGSAPPARKKAKGCVVLPADVDMVLQVHERLLEALNVAHFLSILRPGSAPPKQGEAAPAAGSSSDALVRAVEECFWRWALVADSLQPCEGVPRIARTWSHMSRLLQQMVHAAIPTPDVIAAARRLLSHTTEDVPADDDELGKMVRALFSSLEYEPQLAQLLESILGRVQDAEEGNAAGGADEHAPASQENRLPPEFEVHPRVVAVIKEFLPKFRNLRSRFAAEGAPAPESPGQDKRRIFASPTPQKANQRRSDVTVGTREFDGESVTDSAMFSEGRPSIGRRSFSVRSRSPPPQDPGSEAETLFRSCFSKRRNSEVSLSSVARSDRRMSTAPSVQAAVNVSDEEGYDID